METLRTYGPLLIPLILINLTLAIVALVHVLRHPTYRFGNRALWICLVLFVQLIGPTVYFVWGRGDRA